MPKSAFQALSLDEAVLFGQFYRINLTPVFFVETLADLEKKVREGRTPEDVVGTIARKTGNLTADPCVHHERLVLRNLLGYEVLMDGRPHVQGGRSVGTGEKEGLVFEQSREAEALGRWQQGRFLDIERDIAREWRERLKSQRLGKMDLSRVFQDGRRPRSLLEAKEYGDWFVRQRRGAFLASLNVLGVPPLHRGRIFQRWLECGAPSIAELAPYAAYVASVMTFFQVAVAADLISGERASNSADIAYLFYLPFCMVFTSNDHLHVKTAPLFLRRDQAFVLGTDIKADLRKLDAYFSAQPAEVLDRGVMCFDLPFDDGYLTVRLRRRFLPGWRPHRPEDVKVAPAKEAVLVREFRAAEASPAIPDIDMANADFVIMKRVFPETLGKWRIISHDVAERGRAAERARRNAAPPGSQGSINSD